MNRVEIRGGLTREPDFRFVGQANTPLLEMSVAVNGTRYDPGERRQVVKTTFVTVQVWGLQADEIMQRYGLDRGDEVHVVGELDQREVEKRDGTKETKTRVTGLVVTVLRAKNAGQAAQTLPAQAPFANGPAQGQSEPPF